jgi:hypothetical protein
MRLTGRVTVKADTGRNESGACGSTTTTIRDIRIERLGA